MLKKSLSLVLGLIMTFGVLCASATAAELTASPTASTVLVNGKNISFNAYLINGNNYFKLRDLAYTLSGTEKQFDVGWDGTKNSISLTSGQGYTVAGGEMAVGASGAKTPVPTSSKIIKDGKEVRFTAYLIDGNNYFKLRDIAEAFDFGVDWDGAKNTIVIDTSKGYVPDATASEEPVVINVATFGYEISDDDFAKVLSENKTVIIDMHVYIGYNDIKIPKGTTLIINPDAALTLGNEGGYGRYGRFTVCGQVIVEGSLRFDRELLGEEGGSISIGRTADFGGDLGKETAYKDFHEEGTAQTVVWKDGLWWEGPYYWNESDTDVFSGQWLAPQQN